MRCQWCGEPVRWVRSGDKWILIEERLTPYQKTERDDGRYVYTGEGYPIPGVPLPEERADEADGFRHRRHWCMKKPALPRPRTLSRKDKYRQMME